jgi:hypothetical protein
MPENTGKSGQVSLAQTGINGSWDTSHLWNKKTFFRRFFMRPPLSPAFTLRFSRGRYLSSASFRPDNTTVFCQHMNRDLLGFHSHLLADLFGICSGNALKSRSNPEGISNKAIRKYGKKQEETAYRLASNNTHELFLTSWQ